MRKLFLTITMMFLMIFTVVGCTNNEGGNGDNHDKDDIGAEKSIVKLSFVTNDTSILKDFEKYAGENIELPILEREWHKFLGWYSDSNFSTKFESTIMPEKDMILYANWQFESEKTYGYSIDVVNHSAKLAKNIITYIKGSAYEGKLTLEQFNNNFYKIFHDAEISESKLIEIIKIVNSFIMPNIEKTLTEIFNELNTILNNNDIGNIFYEYLYHLADSFEKNQPALLELKNISTDKIQAIKKEKFVQAAIPLSKILLNCLEDTNIGFIEFIDTFIGKDRALNLSIFTLEKEVNYIISNLSKDFTIKNWNSLSDIIESSLIFDFPNKLEEITTNFINIKLELPIKAKFFSNIMYNLSENISEFKNGLISESEITLIIFKQININYKSLSNDEKQNIEVIMNSYLAKLITIIEKNSNGEITGELINDFIPNFKNNFLNTLKNLMDSRDKPQEEWTEQEQTANNEFDLICALILPNIFI